MKNLFLLTILLCAGCSMQPETAVSIALIRGETMNVRSEVDEPSPYEVLIAEEALSANRRPRVKCVSRKRALELFKEEKVDWVVPGHASQFPEEFSQYVTEWDRTEAVFLQLKDHPLQIKSAKDLYNIKTSIAVIRDSAFEKHFVKKVGKMSLIIINDFSEVLTMLKKKRVSGVVIDKKSLRHAADFIPEFRTSDLGLGEEKVIFLKR